MFDKERLLKIQELDETKIGQMDDGRLSDFDAAAKSMTNDFPSLAENIKAALESNDIATLAKHLRDICTMLRMIYAEKLVTDCLSKIEAINDTRYEDLQAYVVDFLKTVAALSIDLQMAEFQEASGETTGQPDADGKVIAAGAAKNTILAVDDRAFFLTAIKTMLQDTGYAATCINSGAAALNYLKNHRPDLFILDIEMPEMDGYELANRIRASGQKAPIIFLTGNANKDSVVKALKAGAADFIVKPVTKDQLIERIGRYIQPEVAQEEDE